MRWFVRNFLEVVKYLFPRTGNCIMCDTPCDTALQAINHNKKGADIYLCDVCFGDNNKLAHAMAFANCVWRDD